jgi:hypothetical protein
MRAKGPYLAVVVSCLVGGLGMSTPGCGGSSHGGEAGARDDGGVPIGEGGVQGNDGALGQGGTGVDGWAQDGSAGEACGEPGQQCCANNGCNGGICSNNVCLACGAPGTACCPGDSCNGPGCCYAGVCLGETTTCGTTGGVCQGGRCSSCGGPGQGCCSNACYDGLLCQSGKCASCGNAGDVCCPTGSGVDRCKTGNTCSSANGDGTCVRCGGLGDVCCANDACSAGCCAGGRCLADPAACSSAPDASIQPDAPAGSTGGIAGTGGAVGKGGAVGTGGGGAGSGGAGGATTSSPPAGPEPAPEPAPEPGPDGGSVAACANATPIVDEVPGTGRVDINSTGPFCFITCNDFKYGWGCNSFTESMRSITVNGTSVYCGGKLPAKEPEGYYYFEIGAGGHTWDSLYWAGTPVTSCTPPPGGWMP